MLVPGQCELAALRSAVLGGGRVPPQPSTASAAASAKGVREKPDKMVRRTSIMILFLIAESPICLHPENDGARRLAVVDWRHLHEGTLRIAA